MSNRKTAPKTFQRQFVNPKSKNQDNFIKTVRENDITIGIGPAGSGKTFISVGLACEAFLAGQVDKIVITRPVVEAGEKLGFLPGDFNEKIAPYLVPIFDEMEKFLSKIEIAEHRKTGALEVCPLGFTRGRNFHKTFMLLDEAQNATYDQIIMFMTRLGQDSKLIMTGDIFQSDLPNYQKGGLKIIADKLAQANIDGFGLGVLEKRDIIRNPIIADILEVLDKEE